MVSYSRIRNEILELSHTINENTPAKVFLGLVGGHSTFVIYGAGNVGRNCLNFTKTSSKLAGFIDIKANTKPEYCEYPVYHPDDKRLSQDFRKDTLVVLALVLPRNEYSDIEEYLRNLGYSHFVNAVYQLGACVGHEYFSAEGKSLFAKDASGIVAAFDLLSDDHSRDVFYAVFRAYALFDYDLKAQSPNMTQYMDVEIPFRNNYRSFVDCGAFMGDTLTSLMENHKPEVYFGFEPDLDNFMGLSKVCNELDKKGGGRVHCTLIPAGVGRTTGFLRFYGEGTSGRIDDEGGNIIQVVRLDDVLKGFDGLMIKMDVEGAEVPALMGAKSIITKTKPDLAICVYHQVGDLWQIPLLLHEWVPDYRFFLRNHSDNTMETVLYATISEQSGVR